jgi:hypothetical protein
MSNAKSYTYKVKFKSHSANQAWSTLGYYGSEQSALANASRVADKYFMVIVVDPSGATVWSA